MISRDTIIRGTLALVIMLSIAATFGIVLLIQSKSLIYSYAVTQVEKHASEKTPFPVSVNMTTKTITEDPAVETFFTDTLANAPSSRERWWNQVAAFFADEDWYQNLASPVSRVIVVWPGKRKEEVAKEIGDILRWDKADREEFQELMDTTTPFVVEGKYLPGQYVAHRGATPADVQQLIYDAFKSEVLDRYTEVVSAQVPLEDTLIIASLIEREASDFTNMREVSGVIWNRLFTDMPLQLDATLQYVKGSDPYQP
ncbi:endolytic transglycosylase MltG, partial [Candidatus Kaiserbacteria bacterium]|nr:endolytic transglycosylase MltG [Candidatus Kaiserbacteria bacterium]